VIAISPQWLAGFFDGEGCISAWVPKSESTYSKQRYPALKVQISQGDVNILRRIKDRYHGGSINAQARNGRVFCSTLSWTNTAAEPFLRDILPYVILKRELCLIALEWIDCHRSFKSTEIEKKQHMLLALQIQQIHIINRGKGNALDIAVEGSRDRDAGTS